MGDASNTKATQKKTTTHLDIEDPAFDNPNSWDDQHAFVPEPSPEPGPSMHVEEVDDEEAVRVRQFSDTKSQRFVESYPRPVGVPIGQGKTKFQVLYEENMGQGQGIYAPFANNEEWELAQWLSRRVGQKATDEYLKLSIVSSFAFILIDAK